MKRRPERRLCFRGTYWSQAQRCGAKGQKPGPPDARIQRPQTANQRGPSGDGFASLAIERHGFLKASGNIGANGRQRRCVLPPVRNTASKAQSHDQLYVLETRAARPARPLDLTTEPGGGTLPNHVSAEATHSVRVRQPTVVIPSR